MHISQNQVSLSMNEILFPVAPDTTPIVRPIVPRSTSAFIKDFA
jgi:hypothetical protein